MAAKQNKTSFVKRKVLTLFSRISFILENTSLGGFKYLVEESSNWFFKSIWAIAIILFSYYMVRLINASIKSFYESSISFTLQTTYLGWNTTFPAVSVCEQYNSEKIWTDGERVYGAGRDSSKDDFVADITFFIGTCLSCEACGKDYECPNKFKEIVTTYRSACKDILINCKWNGVEIDCCSHFLPLETELGLCYSLNSHHTKVNNSNDVKTNLISNQMLGPGIVEITAVEDYSAFVHPPEDVPFINSDPEMSVGVLQGTSVSLAFSIVEVTNDADVKQVSYKDRECRFPNEKPEELRVHDVYSYSSCVVQCRVNAQLAACNCTHHLMPAVYESKYCDVKGLICLSKHYENLTSLKGKKASQPGLSCSCMPACNEPEYNAVELFVHGMQSPNVSHAKFLMSSLPSLRYNRQVVRTGLDLVVNVGNAIGLFFGASILSIVELFYYLCFRKWN